MGSGMVPFERASVSFYRPSITFPIRVSEIIAAFVLQHATFAYPTSSFPQISPCSPGIRRIAFWLQRAKVLG